MMEGWKKILVIWIVGVIINLLIMWYLIYGDFFIENQELPIIWMCINFIPLSIVIGYFSIIRNSLENKNISRLLMVFLVLCLVGLYSRNVIDSYEDYIKILSFTPYVLLPLQALIIIFFIRVFKLNNLLSDYFKSTNRDAAIDMIKSGKTLKAMDMLLEESKLKNKNVFNYLSIQRNNLVRAEENHLNSIISYDEYNRTLAKANKSLLKLLTK